MMGTKWVLEIMHCPFMVSIFTLLLPLYCFTPPLVSPETMVSQTRPETNKDGSRLSTKFQTSPFRRRRSIQFLGSPPREKSFPTKTLPPKSLLEIPSSALKVTHHHLPLKKRPEVVSPPKYVAADDNDDHRASSRSRQRIQQVLKLYRETLERLVQENKGKRANELCLRAVAILKCNGKMLNAEKRLGSIPGVEVGDEFQFRGEMRVIGLHCQCISGVDYTEERGGKRKLATIIVASGRYSNFMKSSNVLIYSGHGGNPNVRNGTEMKYQRPRDQKLERGNLALKNNMDAKAPVRVIRCLNSKTKKDQDESPGTVYVHDGLYLVNTWRQERGEYGKLVFKFELVRNADQPMMFPMEVLRGGGEKRRKSKKEEIVQKDISEGGEEIAVSVVNAWDGERPSPFTYVLNCSNGSGYPVKFQFEVFRTNDSSGWGLRSRQYISSGSFICEYVGEYREVKSTDGIRYHFDTSRSGGGFSMIIDATRYGNLSRFINRSDQPNLLAKVYDGDSRAARVLIHAAKDIPPRRELTL